MAKSFSEQYGLSDTEITDILAKAKAEKDAKIPESAQSEIDKQMEKRSGVDRLVTILRVAFLFFLIEPQELRQNDARTAS